MTVYDPTADPKSTGVTLAPRLDTFKGKRAGILDNGKPNAGFADARGGRAPARLLRRHGDRQAREAGGGTAVAQALEDLARCDFALVGSSD